MYIKVKIECECGCSYEVTSEKDHHEIKCPNCNTIFSHSSNLINALSSINKIDDSGHKSIKFINLWEDLTKEN